MKNLLKLTGLMMSAVLCLFTSCSGDNDDEENVISGGSASVEVQLAISSESFDWIDGSFIITYSPSGKTEEVSVNNVLFAIDANPTNDAELLSFIKSGKAKKYTYKATCDRGETKISVTPNIKVKPGVEIKDDAKYSYEVSGIIRYQKSLGSWISSSGNYGSSIVHGDNMDKYIAEHNSLPFVWINIPLSMSK